MRRFFEVYAQTRKQRDLVTNVYLFRPLATPLVVLFAGTRVTPNQITLASFLVAVAAVALLFWPGYVGLVAAGLVFTLSYLLDCVDGMLARLKGMQSTQGHLFDFLMDEIKSFLILGGISLRLYRETGGDHFLIVGVVGLVALATGIAVTTFERRPEITGGAQQEGAARTTRPPSLVGRAVALAFGVAHLVVHYPSYFLLVAVIGRAELYLYPYVTVITLYALRSLAWLTLRHGLR